VSDIADYAWNRIEKKLLKTNSDVSTLPPHWNSNTDTNIYIYVLADTYIGYLGFHFHASLPGCYDQCSNLGKRYRGGVAAQKPWTKQTLALGYQPQPFLCLAASRTHARTRLASRSLREARPPQEGRHQDISTRAPPSQQQQRQRRRRRRPSPRSP
jgi:hypothetical protein